MGKRKWAILIGLVLCRGASWAEETGGGASPDVEATFEYHQLIPREQGRNALWLADGTVAVQDEKHIAYFRAGAQPHHYEIVRMNFDGTGAVVAMPWHDEDTRRPEHMALAGDTLYAASAVTLRSVTLDDAGNAVAPRNVLAKFSSGMQLRIVGSTPVVMVGATTTRIDVEPADTTPATGGVYMLVDGKLSAMMTGREVADLLGFADPNAIFGLGFIAFDVVPTGDDKSGWALAAVVQVGNQANQIIAKRSFDAAPRVLDKIPAYMSSAVTLSRDGTKVFYDANDKAELRLASIDGAAPPVVVQDPSDGFNTFRRSPRLFMSADGEWALAGWAGVLFRTNGTAREPAARLQTAAAWSALDGVVLQPNLYRPTMYENLWRLVYSQQEWDGEMNWLATAEINKSQSDARPVPRLSEIRFDPPVLSSNYQTPTRVSVRLDTKLPVKRVEGVLMEGNIVPPNNNHYMFPLYDSGDAAQHGDEKAGDGVYSARIFVPAYHTGQMRSVRLSAEVEDDQKLRHAWAAQVGPLPVSAELPANAEPMVVQIPTDAPSVDAPAQAPAPSADAQSPAPSSEDMTAASGDARKALDTSVGLIPVDLSLDADKDGVITAGDARALLGRDAAQP